jgi:hypothetical protein
MDQQPTRTFTHTHHEHATQPQLPQFPPPSRFRAFMQGIRAWLRTRTGRIVVPVIALLLGILIGILSLLLYGLSGDGKLVAVPKAGSGNIIVEANKSFLTQIITYNLRQSGLPGTVQNVDVELSRNSQITVSADDVFTTILGIPISKRFTVVVQLFATSCYPQVHITHADLSGIPVTGFVQTFEGNINTQLREKPSGLPNGFNYCASGVRTEPGGAFITYQAIPVKS